MNPKSDKISYKKAPDILQKENKDGSVTVLNVLDEDYYFIIDAIAAEFWKMVDGKKSVSDIKKALINKHRPPPQAFERGLKACIKKLEKHQLIFKEN